jgi:amino acid permease
VEQYSILSAEMFSPSGSPLHYALDESQVDEPFLSGERFSEHSKSENVTNERTSFLDDASRSISNAYVTPPVIPLNKAPLTAFLLLNTMIGSGILNQPQVFKSSGLIGGSVMFVIACAMTWLGVLLLTDAGVKTGIYEYSGLATHLFGRKGELLVDISIICLTFGALLGYILIVGSTVSDLLQSWGCNSELCGVYWTLVLCVGILVFPFCLMRHFGHFAWLSLFSIFTIVLVLGLVCIGGTIYLYMWLYILLFMY